MTRKVSQYHEKRGVERDLPGCPRGLVDRVGVCRCAEDDREYLRDGRYAAEEQERHTGNPKVRVLQGLLVGEPRKGVHRTERATSCRLSGVGAVRN